MLDPSAARHLKIAVDRAKRGGCKVIYCRMNPSVREAMVAIKVIKLQVASVVPMERSGSNRGSLEETLLPRHSPVDEEPSKATGSESVEFYKTQNGRSGSKGMPMTHAATDGRPSVTKAQSLLPELPEAPTEEVAVGDDEGQYFKQETDALDYCEDLLVEEYHYANPSVARMIRPYMTVYHRAYMDGERLPEWCFEEMNGMPKGTMERLRPLCRVLRDLHGAELIPQAAEECPLFFILQGGASVVELMPEAQGARDFAVEGQFRDEVKGFSFYPGRRLHKRYPVGHVLGQASFFLKLAGHVIDADRVPQVYVSARLSTDVEIWALSHADWQQVPEDLRSTLMNVLACQMAEDIQHFQLQER